MSIRKLLIWLPIAITVFLVQSFFWVPTYEEQTRGNPRRLEEFITASTGDASILNPILAADSSSGTIIDKVFEGLIERDENLRFRGKLATSWEIFEEAYLLVNENISPDTLIRTFKKAKDGECNLSHTLKKTIQNIEKIEILPEENITVSQTLPHIIDSKDPITLHIKVPQKIMFTLKKVDQTFFENLKELLGQDYLSHDNRAAAIKSEIFLTNEQKKLIARSILPPYEHNPVIIFHLRPNVPFHDGHIFDAEDVKFTYESIVNPKNVSPRIPDYEPVKSVEIIDPLTVRITYKQLYSPALTSWSMGIIPHHLLNDEALRTEALKKGKDPEKFSIRNSTFNRHPIGMGPFVFKKWKSDQYIELKRFDQYWEVPPHYKYYIFRIIPDLLTQEMEFYAGTVDAYEVQPHQVVRLKDDPRFQSFTGLSFGYTYIGYNMRRKPFNDLRIRRALGMAIDIDKIMKYVLYDQGERITGPFVKQTDFYNHSIPPLPYDPDGALKLLKEAGYRRNSKGWLEKEGEILEFTLITNSGNPIRKAIATIVQDSWRKIGVNVSTDIIEWSVFIQERVNKLDFDTLILGWNMGIDPDLYQIWHSSQTGKHQLNFVGFKNKEADELIIKIRQEYDHDRQVEYCHRLHEIIAHEQPYTFLYVGKWTALLDKRIVIKEVDAQGTAHYKKITPTKTGDYGYYFNKWIKLPEAPHFSD
jgi:ABC-type transport system substrate-binding protein